MVVSWISSGGKRTALWGIALTFVLCFGLTEAAQAQRRSGRGGGVSVRGYVRSNGTYVAPHIRTSPDKTRLNNWSTEGNVNPYTGKSGTHSEFPVSPTRGEYSASLPRTSLPVFSYPSGVHRSGRRSKKY